MDFLDMKTVLVTYLFTNALCLAVMAVLWTMNRGRFPGLGFWLADFVAQILSIGLAALRGVVPVPLSVMLVSPLAVGGTMLLFRGLERFTGRPGPWLHNLAAFLVFTAAQAWFSFAAPSLLARNHLLSLALIWICGQCAWLLLGRVPREARRETRFIGLVFLAYVLFSLGRIVADLLVQPGKDLFSSALPDTLVLLSYKLLFIALTFGLVLMVNRRLIADLEGDITERLAAETKIRALLGEKELILREAHHRMKNNMAVVHSILEMEAEDQKAEEARTAIEEAARRMRGMGLLYDRLYRGDAGAALDAAVFLPPLLDEIVAVFGRKSRVRVEASFEPIPLGGNTLTSLGILLNELVTNSMKYAFDGNPDPAIRVGLSLEEGEVLFEYGDNGRGLPDPETRAGEGGFGIELVSGIAESLGGALVLDPGTKGYRIRFPAARGER